MRSQEFPALDAMIRSSVLERWTRSVAQTLKAAASTSRTAAVVANLRDEAGRLGPAGRCRMAGVVMIGAAVAWLVASRLQPPHQVPLAAPILAAGMFVVGAVLVVAGDAIARSLKSSRVWSLWRRFMTDAPDR